MENTNETPAVWEKLPEFIAEVESHIFGPEMKEAFDDACQGFSEEPEARIARLEAWFDALRNELKRPVHVIEEEEEALNILALYLFRLKSSWININNTINALAMKGEFDEEVTAQAGLTSALVGQVEKLLPDRVTEYVHDRLTQFTYGGQDRSILTMEAERLENLFQSMEAGSADNEQLKKLIQAAREKMDNFSSSGA